MHVLRVSLARFSPGWQEARDEMGLCCWICVSAFTMYVHAGKVLLFVSVCLSAGSY